ncbi:MULTISPECIES: hypothetical protein [unclassified Lysobacter]|uniref:XAC0095 family protein n=1 Tax=unclassified Lysobacter TaxID=2635362 RepID=UPI001C22192E|nr:hypothetical protein [Lysobacter sp. MMG2]MBU8975892.1 hypothetical protein [Lysobacter sp. MMG2]
MSKPRRTGSHRPPTFNTPRFKISEASRDTLYRAREHLLLLSSVCAARVQYDARELELSANAMVTCFQRLANDVSDVLAETNWQEPE